VWQGVDGWDRERNAGIDAGDRARTLHAHGAAGTNKGSERGQKANRAQPLQLEHVSGRGRVRHRAWA
jgi:hypothetical protein